MEVNEIIKQILEKHIIQAEIAERLVLRYRHWGSNNESVKTAENNKKLTDINIRPTVGAAIRAATLDDMELHVMRTQVNWLRRIVPVTQPSCWKKWNS